MGGAFGVWTFLQQGVGGFGGVLQQGVGVWGWSVFFLNLGGEGAGWHIACAI